jgi:hypothetical protein
MRGLTLTCVSSALRPTKVSATVPVTGVHHSHGVTGSITLQRQWPAQRELDLGLLPRRTRGTSVHKI